MRPPFSIFRRAFFIFTIMKQKNSLSGNLLGIALGFTGAILFFYYAIQGLEEQKTLIAFSDFIVCILSIFLIVANVAEMRQKA